MVIIRHNVNILRFSKPLPQRTRVKLYGYFLAYIQKHCQSIPQALLCAVRWDRMSRRLIPATMAWQSASWVLATSLLTSSSKALHSKMDTIATTVVVCA